MQFTSFQFAIFFPIVVFLYYIMPKKLRQPWLLIASYYFYMGWNAKYALLIFTSTVITYFCALFIEKTDIDNKGRRKLYLVVSLLLNLGILGFFKYFYFMHDTVAGIVSLFGIKLKASKLDILLPVGISFYTFQALGYTIDVYRGDVKAEKTL